MKLYIQLLTNEVLKVWLHIFIQLVVFILYWEFTAIVQAEQSE